MLDRFEHPQEELDAVAIDLGRLRADSGNISYAEIARRIAARREQDGLSAAAARISRSTVFDAFRVGRRRLNPGLVSEIALALGEDDEAAEGWRQRCVVVQSDAPSQTQLGEAIPTPRSARGRASGTLPQLWESDDPRIASLRVSLTIAIMLCCLGLNLFGDAVTERFDLPLFLDMIGTAAAAIALGPWYGAVVGFSTNGLAALTGSPESLAFAPVNVVGALIWGYGFQRVQRFRSIPGLFVLNMLVAFACSLIAVFVTLFVFNGVTDHSSSSLAATFATYGTQILLAIFSVNLLVSVCDKLIAGYIAFAVQRLVAPLGLGSPVRPVPQLLRSRSKTSARE